MTSSDDVNYSFHSLLAGRGQTPTTGPADADSACAESKRLEDICASPETAGHEHWDPPGGTLDDFSLPFGI